MKYIEAVGNRKNCMKILYSKTIKSTIGFFLSRKDCFTSDYFEGCLKVLHKYDDKDKIMEDLSTIHKLE